jgi:cellulose 1,4-beta-cellobiosidase
VSPNVVGYNVYRRDSSTTTYSLVPGSPTPIDTFVDNTVGNGTLYTYVVRAINDSNQESPDSNYSVATPTGPPPPPAPTGLTATPLDATVELSWTAQAGASYYDVKRSTLQSGPYSVVAMAKTNGYTDTGLVNGKTYYYVVSAVDSSGAESVNSSQVSAQPYVSINPPPAPNNLTATGGVSQIQLSWDAVGGATLYKIHRAPTAFGPWNQIGTAQTNSYTDTLVLYGEIYYYNVSAVNGIGEGAQSATVSATDGSD